MARRRMIDPNIWQSEDFSKLSMLARLLFIGMFSNADDQGRGRAKPVYLKSIIFPYDDGMRVADVEKSLSEIGAMMSVTFYDHDGNQYYSFDNWAKWQRVDKPQTSKFPGPEDTPELLRNDSGITPESFRDGSRLKEKKIKEEKEKRKESACAQPSDDFSDLPDALISTLNDWIAYKAERKEPYKPTGWKSFVAEVKNSVAKHGENAVIEQFRKSMSNGWRGHGLERIGAQGGTISAYSQEPKRIPTNTRPGSPPPKLKVDFTKPREGIHVPEVQGQRDGKD